MVATSITTFRIMSVSKFSPIMQNRRPRNAIVPNQEFREKVLTLCPQFDWMLEWCSMSVGCFIGFPVISFTRHNHTHAAQAQDGHKEEGAEYSASHGVIKAPGGAFGNPEGGRG